MDPRVPLWKHLADRLADRRSQGLYREPIEFQSHSGRLLSTSKGEVLVHFGSNDYLGLSWHPDIKRGLQADEDRYGAGASPLLAGHSSAHEALRMAVADFEETEDAILFSSGFAANLGVVSSLAGPGDAIFSDELNHASLIDGCRLSKAKVFVYRHNDMAHLEQLISAHRSEFEHAYIVTDSLFSMDGDIADLASINELAERYDIICIVDEAHATGVFGRGGRGLLSEIGCSTERWVKVGTFSKAIGCSGGFVAANRTVIEWLHNFARSYIYSTSMPVPHCITIQHALLLLQGMEAQRRQLRKQAGWLRAELRALGHRVGGDLSGLDSPILAVFAPDVETVIQWSQKLRRSGLYVPAIRPPTVPANSPMLRISLSTSHLPVDFEQLLQACRF